MIINVFLSYRNDKGRAICPNCLHDGFISDFRIVERSHNNIEGYCKHCDELNKLILNTKVDKIEIKNNIRTPILFFHDVRNGLNFIIKPHKKGFKKWFIDETFRGFCEQYDDRYCAYEEIIYTGQYSIRSLLPKAEMLYNVTKLPLCYFDELKNKKLNFVK